MRLKFDHNQIPHLEFLVTVVTISTSFHTRLSLEQFTMQHFKNSFSLTKHLINCFYVRSVGNVLREDERFMAKSNLEWCHARGRVARCVIGPLDPKQITPPSRWFLMHEGP